MVLKKESTEVDCKDYYRHEINNEVYGQNPNLIKESSLNITLLKPNMTRDEIVKKTFDTLGSIYGLKLDDLVSTIMYTARINTAGKVWLRKLHC